MVSKVQSIKVWNTTAENGEQPSSQSNDDSTNTAVSN